jgi:hypothetical protein
VEHAFVQISKQADPNFAFVEDKITRAIDQWADAEQGGVGRIYKKGKEKVWRTIMIKAYEYVPQSSDDEAALEGPDDDAAAAPSRNPASAVFDRSSPIAPDVTD